MKLSQVTQAIAIARRPVFLWGQPGIGKSKENKNVDSSD